MGSKKGASGSAPRGLVRGLLSRVSAYEAECDECEWYIASLYDLLELLRDSKDVMPEKDIQMANEFLPEEKQLPKDSTYGKAARKLMPVLKKILKNDGR